MASSCVSLQLIWQYWSGRPFVHEGEKTSSFVKGWGGNLEKIWRLFISFFETHEQEMPTREGGQREFGVNPLRSGLCLFGARYQVAVAIARAAFGPLSPPITFQPQLHQRGPSCLVPNSRPPSRAHTHTRETTSHANTPANSIFKHGSQVI